MSAFRNILVPVGDAGTTAGVLDAALGLGQRFGSHVTALHVRTDPALAVPLIGEGLSAAMVDEMIALAETQAAKRAETARQSFEEARGRFETPLAQTPVPGPSAEWIDLTGREEDEVVRRGRLSDLIVCGHPAGDEEIPAMTTLNAALLTAGRPLLLCPARPPVPFGRKVAIAWNGSAEASSAVAWAMPFLREAESVTILTVAEHTYGAVGAPAGELAAYLAWNGINATTLVSQAPTSQAAAELLRQATTSGADLLVMGAYTHSRLRQLILGGVTRHVIDRAPIHCLMCH
ncbi:universal stress protein [Magnetospirillum fulvum]|uniref:Universal stress protein UspA-like nucleotide-binding protein n=1 Tax=Magnetospirillum fulvum MGU-K5 TaxID=1316936 RepID=S9TKH6_MAGFU|nr:universal stress protein [Magnetospirillum fulvum]EPY02771.1 universal stress protein UspA-like nucleotide-binding protein [Magnetospirillum fulvum MGU-K5]